MRFTRTETADELRDELAKIEDALPKLVLLVHEGKATADALTVLAYRRERILERIEEQED